MPEKTPPFEILRHLHCHESFTLIATIVGTRSICDSKPTKAVITRDKYVLATGTGSSSGEK